MQEHRVIEVVINPPLHMLLDVAEIDQHAPVIQFVRFENDDGLAVVSVEVAALALVVEQAMAVAEVDFSGNAIHENRPSVGVVEGF